MMVLIIGCVRMTKNSKPSYIKMHQWDKKNMKVRGTGVEIEAINHGLETQKAKVMMIANKLMLQNSG